ncbi:MAG: hypothetical protein ACRDZP_01995, partial [Acidimicrobiales bacterium]
MTGGGLSAFARSALGATLLWGSAAAGGYAVAWTIASHHAGNHLVTAAKASLSSSRGYDAHSTCREGTP